MIARERTADAERRTIEDLDVPDGWMVFDIGPRTAARFATAISEAGSVFWNGPMGVFELEPFAHGTRTVAETLARLRADSRRRRRDRPGATRYGLERHISHLSTGGGATLELLEGRSLPGVLALQE